MIINEDLEYEESELRLIICQIAIGISTHLAIVAIFITVSIITMAKKPRVVIPNIVDYNQYGEYHQMFWSYPFLAVNSQMVFLRERLSKITLSTDFWWWISLWCFSHSWKSAGYKSFDEAT